MRTTQISDFKQKILFFFCAFFIFFFFIYENSGIQKGILLSRYGDILKNWVVKNRLKNENTFKIDNKLLIDDWIFKYPYQEKYQLSEWERKSKKINLDEENKKLFIQFKEYFKNQIRLIKDDSLNKELELIDKIVNCCNSSQSSHKML